MASITKRLGPNQRTVWQARVERKGAPKQYRTFDSRALAERWARSVECEFDQGRLVSLADAERMTLAKALDRYALEVVPQKKQVTRESRRCLLLKRYPLAQYSLARIRGKEVADFIRARQDENCQANTIRLDLALLSHVFETCRGSWGMEYLTNPVQSIRGARPKLPPGRSRRLTAEEERRLLLAAEEYGGNIGLIITFAIETAMRRGEIAAMQWEHLGARTLRIPETKTGVPRTVPLSSRALDVLGRVPRAPHGGRIWSLQADSISQAFARTVEACRTAYETECRESGHAPDAHLFRDLCFHDLRHEATSRLFEKDFNVMEVSTITGHKSLQMLKRYTHLSAESLVDRLE